MALPPGFGPAARKNNAWALLCTIGTTCNHTPRHTLAGVTEDAANQSLKRPRRISTPTFVEETPGQPKRGRPRKWEAQKAALDALSSPSPSTLQKSFLSQVLQQEESVQHTVLLCITNICNTSRKLLLLTKLMVPHWLCTWTPEFR